MGSVCQQVNNFQSGELAIRVEHLTKRYVVGSKPAGSLGEWISSWWTMPSESDGPTKAHEFLALRDVSFDVRHGEVVGIIGRNGAGKSTLLKILSRITQPSFGRAEIHGRVASLLEVGTGFHPELTGRENIYLNGAILGMKMAEIKRKFDEIVAFAEIDRFLDTPVKRYSSGMYVRLAFAVAAHLDPEILIIDEVLAVGDAGFQKKCLGKMEETARGGRTVLFVSHNMPSIQALCSKAILLHNGGVLFDGPTSKAVAQYLASVEQVSSRPIEDRGDRVGGDRFRFTGVEFLDEHARSPCDLLTSGHPVRIRIHFNNRTNAVLRDVGLSISFFGNGAYLCGCRSRAVGMALDLNPGRGFVDCAIPKWPLNGSRYYFNLFAEQRDDVSHPIDWLQEAGTIDVESGDFYGFGVLPAPGRPGVFIDYRFHPAEIPTTDGPCLETRA
jgi:lipopolysaccharide transport system ATP-binding protein